MKIPLKYFPRPGTDIQRACRKALALAKEKNRPVYFDFNGVKMKVHKRLPLKHLLLQRNERMDASYRRYRNSPEGRAAVQQREDEIRQKRQTLNTMMDSLPIIKDHTGSLIVWLGEFTNIADDIAVRFLPSVVISHLESVGFVRNQHVGNDKEWFNNRERLGQWIIGQALECMYQGMPPHPIISKLADDYFLLPEEENV